MLIFFRILGEAELILRIWGAKTNYFQGAEEFSFGDLGRSMHYFQGSREHRHWLKIIGSLFLTDPVFPDYLVSYN